MEVRSDDFNNTNTKSSKPEYEQNSAIVLEGDVQKVTGDSKDMNSSEIDTDSNSRKPKNSTWPSAGTWDYLTLPEPCA